MTGYRLDSVPSNPTWPLEASPLAQQPSSSPAHCPPPHPFPPPRGATAPAARPRAIRPHHRHCEGGLGGSAHAVRGVCRTAEAGGAARDVHVRFLQASAARRAAARRKAGGTSTWLGRASPEDEGKARGGLFRTSTPSAGEPVIRSKTPPRPPRRGEALGHPWLSGLTIARTDPMPRCPPRIPPHAWAELLTPGGNKTVRGTHLDGGARGATRVLPARRRGSGVSWPNACAWFPHTWSPLRHTATLPALPRPRKPSCRPLSHPTSPHLTPPHPKPTSTLPLSHLSQASSLG
jgi:hypothetical protein